MATDDALLLVLRQIRDELREMNGKDSEGNRNKVPSVPDDYEIPSRQIPYPWTYPYTPQQPYVPYWNINQVSGAMPTGSYIVNDHQGERVDPDYDR